MQRKRSSLKREEDNCLEFYSVISVLLKRVSEGFFGDLSDEVIPGPIPNPVVKLVSADGSTWVTACKSRSLPENPFLLFSPRHFSLFSETPTCYSYGTGSAYLSKHTRPPNSRNLNKQVAWSKPID